MLNAYLKELKKESGKSLQNIADGCELPLSTISRIFSGETENPTFHSIMTIIKFLGGSLDELAGIEMPKMKQAEKAMYERIISKHEKEIEEKAARIDRLEKSISKKEKYIHGLMALVFVLVVVIVFVLQ